MERDVVRYPKSHSGCTGALPLLCQRKGQHSADVLGYRAGCSFCYVFSYFDNLCVSVFSCKKIAPAGVAFS